jgi:hypothetical protein
MAPAQAGKGNRELHIVIFGFLGKVFEQGMMDLKDKPPNLRKTVQRILEAMFTFFKDNSVLVNKSIGMSMQSLMENCFPHKVVPEFVVTLFFGSLIEQLKKGSDLMQEKGAAQCLLSLT